MISVNERPFENKVQEMKIVVEVVWVHVKEWVYENVQTKVGKNTLATWEAILQNKL